MKEIFTDREMVNNGVSLNRRQDSASPGSHANQERKEKNERPGEEMDASEACRMEEVRELLAYLKSTPYPWDDDAQYLEAMQRFLDYYYSDWFRDHFGLGRWTEADCQPSIGCIN